MIEQLINERRLPKLLVNSLGEKVASSEDFYERRAELTELLLEKEYGRIPPRPEHMNVEIKKEDTRFCAGKATLRHLELTCQLNGRVFSFPAASVIPKGDNIPAFVHINFRSDVPDKYMPSEEIADCGYAVFSFNYEDVTKDSIDFESGIAPYLCRDRSADNAPGKIAMWAWAAMRLMDYIQTLPVIDKDNIAVVGHSRLGKTALLTGGIDERFNYVISNDSGCCGAAILRDKDGETLEKICEVFPHWFCPGLVKGNKNPAALPFDQHMLLALTVPRHLIVGSAENDLWADPKSEFLCLAAVNPAYNIFGMRGLVHEDKIPTATSVLNEGDSAYHIRHGNHYFSREDWLYYINYIDKVRKSRK